MSDIYEVKLSRRALRLLISLERNQQQRIRAALDLLSENPRPPNCVALRGEDSVYRVRIGDYRIVYEVRDLVLLVYVVQKRTSHR